jgi:hypothetical protein
LKLFEVFGFIGDLFNVALLEISTPDVTSPFIFTVNENLIGNLESAQLPNCE